MKARIFTTRKSLFFTLFMNRVFLAPLAIMLIFKLPLHGLTVLVRRVVRMLTIGAP